MKKSYITYIIALLLFGSNGIVASHIHLTSYDIVLLRTLIGSLFLTGIFLATSHKFTFMHHQKDLLFITLSGIAMGTSWMFLYEAYAQIGVSIASLLYYCGPVIVMVLSPLLFREKLTLVKMIGFAAALGGIFLINNSSLATHANPWGTVCGLLSALMYAAMVMANKKSSHIIGMENALIQLIVSFITVAIFVGIKNGYAISLKTSDSIWVLLLGLANTGIGCFLYFSSIGNLPVQTVAICGYLEPLSAVLFSAMLLGETMLPLQILGACFIIGGALFGTCYQKK